MFLTLYLLTGLVLLPIFIKLHHNHRGVCMDRVALGGVLVWWPAGVLILIALGVGAILSRFQAWLLK